MSKQPNTTLIGAFVVGGLGLFVIAAMLFGGAELFVQKNRFVAYFDGSVKGLRVGANVTFRGVPIGHVTDVRLQAEVDSWQTLVPVTFEVLPGSFQLFDGDRLLTGQELADRVRLDELIEAGLRAKLNVESFVTGQLQIEMDLYPTRPAILRGVNPPYPEIPTIPNDIEQAIGNVERLLSRLNQKIDVDAVLENVQNLLAGTSELVNSDALRDGIAGFSSIVNSPDMQQVPENINLALEEIRDTLETTREVLHNVDNDLEPITAGAARNLERLEKSLAKLDSEITNVADSVKSSLTTADEMMHSIDRKIDESSALPLQLERTLREMENAARALRVFFEYVETHPEALLRGKRKP